MDEEGEEAEAEAPSLNDASDELWTPVAVVEMEKAAAKGSKAAVAVKPISAKQHSKLNKPKQVVSAAAPPRPDASAAPKAAAAPTKEKKRARAQHPQLDSRLGKAKSKGERPASTVAPTQATGQQGGAKRQKQRQPAA